MKDLHHYPHRDIKGESFLSEIYQFDRQLLFMRRQQHYLKKRHVDTYASNWFVGLFSQKKIEISLRSGEKEIILSPGSAVFLPKFSIVEWQVLKPYCEWYSYMGDFEISPEFKNKRFVFTPKDNYLPKRVHEFKAWLIENERSSIPLLDQRVPSAIAQRFKNLIDHYFQENLQITEAAKQLNISRVVLTRAFTQSYGLTPVQYRNKLRVFDGLKMFSNFKRVNDIFCSSGFNHQGQYIKNFRNYLGLNPKSYFAI